MSKKSSCEYDIRYHLLWCPKHKEPQILDEPEIKTFLEDQIYTISDTQNYALLELQIMPNYVHIYISTSPFESPTNIIKVFKGVTALRLFKKFPELDRRWKGKLWSSKYYIGTGGMFNQNIIKDFVEKEMI